MSGMDREIAQALEEARAAHFDARGEACDYAALAASAERARLAERLAGLEAFDIRRAGLPAQTAFWINAFNAVVLRDAAELQLAARHQDVQAFFERPRLKVGAHPYSLDDIEHGLLRGNIPKQGRRQPPMARGDPRLEYMPLVFDERVHFALHSACRSSPALRVYEAGKLDRQLEDAAAAYVRRTSRVEGGGAVLVVSRIFRWFAADFGGESDIIEFVTARLGDEAAVEAIDRRLGAVKLAYAEFDWTLNRR
jgi:hypothetical protein